MAAKGRKIFQHRSSAIIILRAAPVHPLCSSQIKPGWLEAGGPCPAPRGCTRAVMEGGAPRRGQEHHRPRGFGSCHTKILRVGLGWENSAHLEKFPSKHCISHAFGTNLCGISAVPSSTGSAAAALLGPGRESQEREKKSGIGSRGSNSLSGSSQGNPGVGISCPFLRSV